MAGPSSRHWAGTPGAHTAIAAAFGVCRRTLAWPESASSEISGRCWEAFGSLAMTLQFSWITNPFLLLAGAQVAELYGGTGWDTAMGKRLWLVEMGLLKSEQWSIPNSVCLFLVGFLCERFWSLASELVLCCAGNRSRRNWDSTVCPKHRRGVVRACGIKTKPNYTSEARQEFL